MKSGTRKKPLPHQAVAIHKIKKHYLKKARGKLILPCGTGKTVTAYWAMLGLSAKTTVYVVPSIHLIKQSLDEFTRQATAECVKLEFLCVCSDSEVASDYDQAKLSCSELGSEVTTSPDRIRQWLGESKRKRRVIFTTYQSGLAICEGLSGVRVDFCVFDEAHRTCGVDGKMFSMLVSDANISVSKRLFMTATQRIYTGVRDDVISMDDPEIYGETIFEMTFKEAIESGLLCDYRVITLSITNKKMEQAFIQNNVLSDADLGIKEKFSMVAAMIAIRRTLERLCLTSAIAYLSTIKKAKRFAELLNLDIGVGSVEPLHVSGAMASEERLAILKRFAESPRAVVTNARCLQEGVNISCVDCIAFVDPKKSTVDVVQAVGRALRLHPGKKMAYVLIPVFLDEKGELSQHHKSYAAAIRIISSIASVDERIVEQMHIVDGLKKDSIVQHKIDDGELSTLKISELLFHLREKVLVSTKMLVGFASLEEHQKWCRENGVKTLEAYKNAKKPACLYAKPTESLGITAKELFLKQPFVSLEDCRKWCRQNAVQSERQYREMRKPIGFPSNPWREYGINRREFFGKLSTVDVDTCRKWCSNNGISQARTYRQAEKPAGFPAEPWKVYSITIREFFGSTIIDLNTCVNWCKSNGIDSATKYKLATKPIGFPYAPWKQYGLGSSQEFSKMINSDHRDRTTRILDIMKSASSVTPKHLEAKGVDGGQMAIRKVLYKLAAKGAVVRLPDGSYSRTRKTTRPEFVSK